MAIFRRFTLPNWIKNLKNSLKLKIFCTALLLVIVIFEFPMWQTDIFMTFKRTLPYTLISPLLLLIWIRRRLHTKTETLLEWARNSKLISRLFIIVIPISIVISAFVTALPYYRAVYHYYQLQPSQNDYNFHFISTGISLREHIESKTYEDYLETNLEAQEHDEKKILTEQDFYEEKQDQLKYIDRMDANVAMQMAYFEFIHHLRFIVSLFMLSWMLALICIDSGAKHLTAHLIYSVLMGFTLVLLVHMVEYGHLEQLSPLGFYIIVAALPTLLSLATFRIRILFKRHRV